MGYVQPRLSEGDKEQISKVIGEKIPHLACPMCANTEFSLADGLLKQTLQERLSTSITMGGPSIPSALIICNNCGLLSQHALGILGLLEDSGGEDDG